MKKNADIWQILNDWPYDPEDNVRLLRLADGRKVIQVRLPVGIEQYEVDGRPDGEKPHGMDSELSYHLAQLAEAKANGKEVDFCIDTEDCAALFDEGVLFYYRYLRLFQLEDWERTRRDTARNLRLFDLVSRYAEREEDRAYLEQWRPYITRMHAVSSAMIELRKQHHNNALRMIRDAISTIEGLDEVEEATFGFERRRSLSVLSEMADQIEKTLPVDEADQLERELGEAVEAEEFERAAELRDLIRSLRDKHAAKKVRSSASTQSLSQEG